MNEDPLQEALADESAFTGETDESELQALVSRLQTNILIIGSTCRVLAIDNNTKEKEEKILENNEKILFVIPPDVTHAIENIGNEASYLLCFSHVKDRSKTRDVVNNKIV